MMHSIFFIRHLLFNRGRFYEIFVTVIFLKCKILRRALGGAFDGFGVHPLFEIQQTLQALDPLQVDLLEAGKTIGLAQGVNNRGI